MKSMSTRRRRSTILVATLSAFALVLAACGNGGDGDDPEPDDEAVEEAEEPDSEDEPAGDADIVEDGESLEINVSIFHPEGDPWTQIIQPFFDEVEERTAGRITFNPFFAGSLASVGDNLDSVASGAVDMGLDLASTSSRVAPEFTYFEALGSYPQDYADQWDAIYGDLHPEFAAIMEREGVRLLVWGPGGSELIFFNGGDDFLVDPEDFAGLTLRTAGTWQGQQIDALGGSSISMDPGELYLALQTGTVDATPQAATLGLGASLYEVAPNLSNISLTFNTLLYVINPDVWDSLSDEDQRIFEEAAERASLAVPATMQEQEQLAIEEMQSRDGVEFYRLSDDERQAIFDQIAPVLEEAADISRGSSDEGQRLIDAIQSYID